MGKTAVAVAVLSGCAALVALSAAAGTQQCNTACQSRMTDCILGCDGKIACELECKKKAVGCVNACSSDAGTSTTPAAEPGDAAASPIADAPGEGSLRARGPGDAGRAEVGRLESGRAPALRDR
jgi:hypothetical protein